jgi:excinuclease UvrABC helicase subunit UvrB
VAFVQSEQEKFKLHSSYQPTGDQPQMKEFFPENAVEYFVSYYVTA